MVAAYRKTRPAATAEDGGPAAARGPHTRAEAKLQEARASSSRLRLRRGRRLRLRLVERNTMLVLDSRDSSQLESYGRFTKTAET